ncbi:MAG TPA: hypothetical protein VNJ46_03080 [Gaiellaceae bacterium]|nr:hypothetical protein [Gaiellaceae bacterium]
MSPPRVEILYFRECPHYAALRPLVEQIARELGVELAIAEREIEDMETAQAQRFLGSPTVRVDGRDVEPGADERREYVLGCRVYRSETGLAGQPPAEWIRDALRRAAAA